MHDDSIAAWDREALTFDEAPDHGLHDPRVRAAWTALLLPLIGAPGRRVADLGSGTGTLAALMAVEGQHLVHGIDVSPAMVARARAKVVGIEPAPVFDVADAAAPPLPTGSFDVVLCRHVLWALPDPAAALERWISLLAPGGALVLVEGRWSTGAGLSADETVRIVRGLRRHVELRMLADPIYWGGETGDERYVVVSRG